MTQQEADIRQIINNYINTSPDGPNAMIMKGIALILSKVGRLPTDYVRDIETFHRKFNIHYEGEPRLLPGPLQKFRSARLREELDEYDSAVKGCDLAGQFDALVDLVYIALGNAHLNGLPFEKGWQMVHAANMQKELASKENPGKYGNIGVDIVKPKGWKAPDLNDII